MMTQETTPVKIWGWFNLTILKVNLNLLWKNRSFTIMTYTTNILLPPTSINLLTQPCASFETMNSFFLGFSSKYKHSRLCIFKLFCAAIEWSSCSQSNLILDNPKHVWRQPPLDLTIDSHKQQYEQPGL